MRDEPVPVGGRRVTVRREPGELFPKEYRPDTKVEQRRIDGLRQIIVRSGLEKVHRDLPVVGPRDHDYRNPCGFSLFPDVLEDAETVHRLPPVVRGDEVEVCSAVQDGDRLGAVDCDRYAKAGPLQNRSEACAPPDFGVGDQNVRTRRVSLPRFPIGPSGGLAWGRSVRNENGRSRSP